MSRMAVMAVIRRGTSALQRRLPLATAGARSRLWSGSDRGTRRARIRTGVRCRAPSECRVCQIGAVLSVRSKLRPLLAAVARLSMRTGCGSAMSMDAASKDGWRRLNWCALG